MNRIRLLSEQVANQIAAGEVIERPASVVKELVENALDAGAGRVTVEIQAGGRSLVRVTDDGTGMSRDDALLCLERHATSKIQKAEDLAAIVTMGFRGEALPSIASVSRFTLTTRERDAGSPEGTQVVVNGGKISEVKAAGTATGTSVEVRQLFFNLPVRRKFLRTEETEAAHIQHYLTLAALAFPEVAFTFQKDGRLIWQLPAVNPDSRVGVKGERATSSRLEALRERFRALLGDEKLLPVNFSIPLDDSFKPEETGVFETARAEKPKVQSPKPEIRVWGLIGSPGVSRATRESQYLFVNRRPVENRGLNYALIEGYHTSLMKGRYPVCCLFLEIDPAAVDVNVHPAKREVKFHREFEIRKFVAQSVQETLLAFHPPSLRSGATSSPERNLTAEPLGGRSSATPKPSGSPGVSPHQTSVATPVLPHFPEKLKSAPMIEPPKPSVQQSPLPRRSETEAGAPSAKSTDSFPPASVPLLNVPMRLVGVIGRLYVVLESDRGLILLDQHAAHERILYEQMLNRLEQNGSAPSQKLLLPETVELPARDANFLREQLTALTRLGVGLSEFGEHTFLLDALPPFVKATDARHFVLDLVDEL
jgi:DNA mismatch repair protein MutL